MCLDNSDSAITQTLLLLSTGPSFQDTPVNAIADTSVMSNRKVFFHYYHTYPHVPKDDDMRDKVSRDLYNTNGVLHTQSLSHVGCV